MFVGKQFLKSKTKISSLESYIEHIAFASENIFNNTNIWFRGHANLNFELVPNILRNKNYSKEKELLANEEFRNKAKGFIDNYSDFNLAESYFLMQHFGLKTRLLDWTEGSLIALFFSLKIGPNDNKFIDPCIWLINPNELNNLALGINKIISNDQNNILLEYFSNPATIKNKNPIAISSTYSNKRILRQKGCFTIHRTKEDLLSLYRKNKNNNIAKIIINRKKADTILEQLKMAGISESSMFPDLEGLTSELNLKYNL